MTETVANTRESWSERASAPSSWEAAGWTKESQSDRFDAVLAALDPQPGEVLLDYGCGTGFFNVWMPEGVIYVGYDQAPGMITRARADHPDVTFRDQEPLGFVDCVAAVGPFNLPDCWSKQHTWHTIRHLFEKTKRTLVVSLYGGTDERCLVYTEDEISNAVGGESAYNSVERWRHNDILLTLQKSPS